MSQRNTWADIYALEILPAGTSLAAITAAIPIFDRSTTKGVRGVYGTASTIIYNLLPTEHPDLKASTGVIQKELATGKPLDNVVSFISVTAKANNFVVPQLFNAHNLSAFFLLFGQAGISVADGVTNTLLQIMTFVPWDDTEPIRYGNAVKFMQSAGDADTVDQCLKGVIVKRITLRGEEGGVIEGDVEFMGAKYQQHNLSGDSKIANSLHFDTIVPLKFEDLTVKMGGTVISIPKFEITFENNASMQFYNEVTAKCISLGKLNVSGSITVPWNECAVPLAQGQNTQINDYISGIDKTLEFIWGNPSGNVLVSDDSGVDTLAANAKNLVVSNYFAVGLNIRINDYTQNDIDGLPMLDTNFTIVEDGDNTLETATVQIGYGEVNNAW